MGTTMNLEQAIIAALTPLVIAAAKRLAVVASVKLPSEWLPALAMIVGAVVGPLTGLLEGWQGVSAGNGALLGLLGVGGRELAVKSSRIGHKP